VTPTPDLAGYLDPQSLSIKLMRQREGARLAAAERCSGGCESQVVSSEREVVAAEG
jgi:hypothetical protein